MAFNPFHHFRRYSKAVFAVLAIICMLTFVLSSGTMGRGDFFTEAADWIARRGSKPAVITLHGKEYDAQAVSQVQFQRQLANEYMELAVGGAQQNLDLRVRVSLPKLDPEIMRTVSEVIQYRDMFLNAGRIDIYASSMLQTALFRVHFLIQQAQNQPQQEKKTETVETLSALRGLLSLDAMRYAGRQPGEAYFGGVPTRIEDTADFLIWRHHADELGIKLADDDIALAIRGETVGQLTADYATAIDKQLRERYRGGYTKESLYAALGDELRVRLAQVAVAGTSASGGTRTRTAIPVVLTPDEYWHLYEDARTTVKAGMLTVPVEGFVDQVKATPSDDELRKLFDRHKNDEAAPERADPGFKEPRRVQVEWVGASPQLPFYQKAAEQLSQVLPALRLLGATEPANLLGAPLTLDADAIYQEESFRQRELPWTDSLTPRLHDTSYWRPENVALLVGAAVGAPNTGGSVLSGPMALHGRAIVREMRDRAKFGVSAILTAALDPMPLGVLGIPAEVMPKVPLAMVRGPLREKAAETLTRMLVQNDLANFRAEATKKADGDKAALRKFIDEFVKERGLLHGTTTEPRDQFTIVTDPGLAPLAEAYRRGHGQQDVLLRQFGPAFFADRAFGNTTVGLFTPQPFFGDDGSGRSFLYWRTEDVLARVPTFAKARPLVVEAWKRLQARDLARKEAERLAGLAKQAQGDVQKLRDLAAEQKREFFESGPMARKMPQISPFGQGRQYQDPTIPQEKIAYAGPDLLDAVLGLRNSVKGTTVVVSDLPKRHFYVAALEQREPPTPEEFRQTYVNSMTRAVQADTLLGELSGPRRAEYRTELLKQLRDEAKLVINEDARKRTDERPAGE